MRLQFCSIERRGEEGGGSAAADTHEDPLSYLHYTAYFLYSERSFVSEASIGSHQGECVQVSMYEDCSCRLLNLSQGSCILTLGGVHRSNFLCALLSYTGNISLVPVWQVPLWPSTTNARSARHAALADHVSSILTLLPHKKLAAALGPDQTSLAIAWCRDLAERGLYVRDSWHHRDNGLYKWRVGFWTLPKVCCLCLTRRIIKTVPEAFSTSWKGNKAEKWGLHSETVILSCQKRVLFPTTTYVEITFLFQSFWEAIWLRRWETWPHQAGWQDSEGHCGAVSATLCGHEVGT